MRLVKRGRYGGVLMSLIGNSASGTLSSFILR